MQWRKAPLTADRKPLKNNKNEIRTGWEFTKVKSRRGSESKSGIIRT